MYLYFKTYEHPLIEDAKNKFEEVRISKLRGWGTYEDEMKGIKNHLKNINKFPLLTKKKKINVPFCIVANGKSLEKSIPFIKKNKDSMIIVSVGTAIKPLLKEGIQSDFHIEQERIELLKEALKEILPNYEGYFIGASVVNPEVFKMAKKPLMYIREAFSLENRFSLEGSSPIVGNAGFAFAVNFTNEIYLCGMDLGFRLNQKKHASNSFYDEREDKETTGIKVKGNFSDDIYTDSLFLTSKDKIEKMIKIFNLKVYNLSDGAYINGSIPLKDKTLPEIDKNQIKKEILSSFEKINLTPQKPDLLKIIKPVKSVLEKKVNNYKELTGLIDFIDNATDTLANSNPKEYNLLKGSISHILNNLYILSHKVKEYERLKKRVKKELIWFYEDFERKFKSFSSE
jgi:hypothetical protein